MTETEFNRQMREVLRAQGMRCLHIREADQPGVLDLIVWTVIPLPRTPPRWLELKIGDEEVRPSQVDFMWGTADPARCIILRLRGDKKVDLEVPVPDSKGNFMSHGYIEDFRKFDWANFLF